MEFKYFQPADVLKAYVKHYYIFQSDLDTPFNDIVFPSGDMEMIFNLGNGVWETLIGDQYIKTAKIEFWGQITKSLPIRSQGKHIMFGIKFFTHSAGFFLNDEIGLFNNQVSNMADILGASVTQLHMQLLENTDCKKRIELIDLFLIKKLVLAPKRIFKIDKVSNILAAIKKNSGIVDVDRIAYKHNITPRYLHKLVYQNTGLSPSSFNKIMRFQQSLKLIAKNDQPLTAVAYNSGYFDQSHFIKDFKSFTGITPSVYMENLTPVNRLLLQ